MKDAIKRTMALLLVAMLLTACLAGCGTGPVTGNKNAVFKMEASWQIKTDCAKTPLDVIYFHNCAFNQFCAWYGAGCIDGEKT